MKEVMRLKEFSEEYEISSEWVAQLCRSCLGHKFSQKMSDKPNSPWLINPKKFLDLWNKGAFRNIL